MADNSNPGNFANRPHEEVEKIASMGGKASHGGGGADHNPGNFANRPHEEVEKIASMGGHNHSLAAEGRNIDGTFKEGSEAAKEAGAKGGSTSGTQ